MKRILRCLDRRFELSLRHQAFLLRKIPADLSFLHCFGGVAFVLYLILLFTGMLLSVYYLPSGAEAFRSVAVITREVHLGFFIRGLHRWAGHLLLIMVLLHMFRVVLHRAYLPPRELNWLAGLTILLLLFASAFTGALLPWDQKAYWTTVVASGIAATFPLLGESFTLLVRGGPEVSGATLLRFYSLHVIWLPLAMNLLLWVHFHMVKRLGVRGGL